MKHRKSDILWKVILEEVFADLLRFIYPDADQVYDIERGFDFLDKELAELDPQPDEEKDSRFADKLVKVYHRDGVEEWVLLHVEVQDGTSDGGAFAERMYTYFYRIRDHHRGRPLSALAIFTGQEGNRMPRQYTYEYRGTRLTYEYPTLSITAFSDEELDNSPNPFAQVIVAARLRLMEERIPEDRLLALKLSIAKKLLEKGFDIRKVRAIFIFLRNYVLFDKPETNRKFDNQFKETDKTGVMNTLEYIKLEGREEGLLEGREEGLAEGREEGRAEIQEEIVRRMLEKSTLALEEIADLANAPIKVVQKIKEELGLR